MGAFDLSVIRPIKGKPGQLMFTYKKKANSISEAVEAVRHEVSGSGWAVVQSSSIHR